MCRKGQRCRPHHLFEYFIEVDHASAYSLGGKDFFNNLELIRKLMQKDNINTLSASMIPAVAEALVKRLGTRASILAAVNIFTGV